MLLYSLDFQRVGKNGAERTKPSLKEIVQIATQATAALVVRWAILFKLGFLFTFDCL